MTDLHCIKQSKTPQIYTKTWCFTHWSQNPHLMDGIPSPILVRLKVSLQLLLCSQVQLSVAKHQRALDSHMSCLVVMISPRAPSLPLYFKMHHSHILICLYYHYTVRSSRAETMFYSCLFLLQCLSWCLTWIGLNKCVLNECLSENSLHVSSQFYCGLPISSLFSEAPMFSFWVETERRRFAQKR